MTEKILQCVDLLDIQAYYARSTALGLWIPRLGDKIIGFITINASLDVKNDEQVTQQRSKQLRTSIRQTGTLHIMTIRHFLAEEAYRCVNIEGDLLEFAVESMFKGDWAVKSICMLASPLRPAIPDSR